jgi:hypothetical protein
MTAAPSRFSRGFTPLCAAARPGKHPRIGHRGVLFLQYFFVIIYEILGVGSLVMKTDGIYFFHIPKTAGVSVWRFLEQTFPSHRICPWWLWEQLINVPQGERDQWNLFRGAFPVTSGTISWPEISDFHDASGSGGTYNLAFLSRAAVSGTPISRQGSTHGIGGVLRSSRDAAYD